MPEIKRFLVIETREVEVTANDITDAVEIAAAAFRYGQDSNGAISRGNGPEGIWGNTNSIIVVTDVHASDLQPRRRIL